MAVTRTLCRRPLVPSSKSYSVLTNRNPPPPPRHAYNATQASGSKPRRSNPKFVKRLIPKEAKAFMSSDGKLQTTCESRDFFLKHDLEPDNGRMIRFPSSPELSRLASDYHVQFAYSLKHVIHPFDLRFFEPRGNPLAPMKRAYYARKIHEQPMWIMMTGLGGTSNVVRVLTQRRLTRSIYVALRKLGYQNPEGSQEAGNIRGTLWITLYDLTKAARQPPKRFGDVVANALASYCNHRRS